MREKTVVDLSKMDGRQIAYISYYSSDSDTSQEDVSTLDSGTEDATDVPSSQQKNQKHKLKNGAKKLDTNKQKEKTTKENSPITKTSNGAATKSPLKNMNLQKTSEFKESNSKVECPVSQQATGSTVKENEILIKNSESPAKKGLSKEQEPQPSSSFIVQPGRRLKILRKAKVNKEEVCVKVLQPPIRRTSRRLSPPPKRTSVLVLEDRPLPQLPLDASDSDEQQGEEDDNAVYINTGIPGRTSTNDSGLGGSSSAPQDYANNTHIPLKPSKVSQKIQQLLLTLQVALSLDHLKLEAFKL
uniref:Uncharacterized protein n=1 Tax=Ditylenchus dipsaci TaxID=166011 RepID=A0A915E8B9_9BILA